jgi:hypothetical protein|nr:MAG TPA: hypothetical protein [Bacteriophage sp.]DAX46443.1 MAG TPA: hypothetical protein [Ackermannviridae sp.]
MSKVKYGTKLSKFIEELKEVEKNFNKELELYQNDIMAIYIYKIAEATAYDTRFTRDLFRSGLEQGGYTKLSARLYVDPYDHWKDLQKRMQKGDTLRMTKSNGTYYLTIDSEAFDMLNTDPNMPSTRHPRGIDPKLQPFIVEYVTDLLETQSDKDMENVIKVLWNKIECLMVASKKTIKRSSVVV